MDKPEEEYRTVPLVMQIGGKRVVIGEATVGGDQIRGVLGPDAGEELLDVLGMNADAASFSLNFSELNQGGRVTEVRKTSHLSRELAAEFFANVGELFLDDAERLDPVRYKKKEL